MHVELGARSSQPHTRVGQQLVLVHDLDFVVKVNLLTFVVTSLKY